MRVIAVDNEALALEALSDAIREALPDGEVFCFRKPSEALAFVSENKCDIAFLDINMPGISGLDFAAKLRDISEDINIVFVTGYSEYALEAIKLCASDYLLKPVDAKQVKAALGRLRKPVEVNPQKKLQIQCFGNFEVFRDGEPLNFGRNKTKELFAYLVDRRGASCTMGELISVLWDDGMDSESRQSNLRNLISDLKSTLAAVGAEGVIIKGRNSISLNKDAVDCDYYSFLQEKPSASGYSGEYMRQYSWAEMTLGALSFTKQN